MKKTYYLLLSMMLISFAAFSQITTYPEVKNSDDGMSTITKVEVTNKYTIVSIERPGGGDSSWVQVNKFIYIKTPDDKHYSFIKAEGIPLAPDKHTYAQQGEVLAFKLYFQKIPVKDKLIDIIESVGLQGYFNFYAVNLGKSHSAEESHKIRLTTTSMSNAFNQQPNATAMMKNILPLFNGMVKTTMDAQLDYYEQPGKIMEIAKLNKQYYDALVKQGFSDEQALRIITATPITPKSSLFGK